MEGVQKRPLTGMISAGIAAPRPIAVTPGTTLHTLDATSDQIGGPYPDMVNLWVNNATAASIDLTVTIAGGTAFVVAIAAETTVKILDEVVFKAGSTAAVINGFGSGAGLVFWGDFARPL